ncbi:UNVERIFIED_CONTAM: hypothetical protein RMT77_019939 [Armadillidium vulgare]
MNKKKAAIAFVFLSSVSLFFYLSFDHNMKRTPTVTEAKGNQFLFWPKTKSKISENLSVEFSRSNERSFEDKCLTTFNRSSNAGYFEKSQNLEFLKTEKGKEYKKILAYHYDYGKSFRFGFGHEPFEAACCKEKRCFMTDDRSIIPIEEFDAILMHFRNLNREKLPKKR